MTAERMIGPVVAGWTPAPWPGTDPMLGQYCRLDRLDADLHAADLFAQFAGHDWLWDYMPQGPFSSAAAYHRWITDATAGTDPQFWAITESGAAHPVGVAAYLRITPDHGTIEVGHICFSPALQQSRAATEAMFLMMDWAFSHGYRRYEWKCNALNLPSRRAAQRLGFSYEGIFRQHLVVKGRNRDTAWFAITDQEWPALRHAFAQWLAPENFDDQGRQRQRLSDLTAPLRASSDPAI